jgi:hypothetical protein
MSRIFCLFLYRKEKYSKVKDLIAGTAGADHNARHPDSKMDLEFFGVIIWIDVATIVNGMNGIGIGVLSGVAKWIFDQSVPSGKMMIN